MSGGNRIVSGLVLLLVGGALSFTYLYLGDALFYVGLGLVVWGAVSYFRARQAVQDAAAQQALQGYIQAQEASAALRRQTWNLPPPPPPPPPVATPAPLQRGQPTRAAISYVVRYQEGGAEKSASFATFNPAHQFYQHASFASRSLLRVAPNGQETLLAPPPVSTTSVPMTAARPPRAPQYDRLADFLDRYAPSDRFAREREFEIELAQALRNEFGRLHVQRQVPIPQGIIDIQVSGIGIELKIAGTPGSVQRLPGQLTGYREHYGPNLMVVVIDDTGDEEGMLELRRSLESQGTRVFVK